MNLSPMQTIIGVATIAALTFLCAIGKIDGASVAVILAALAGNALGYVNGKKVAKREALAELPPTPPNA